MANGVNPYLGLQLPTQDTTGQRNQVKSDALAKLRRGELRDEFYDKRDSYIDEIKERQEGGIFSNPLIKGFLSVIPGMKEIMMLDTFRRGDKLKSYIDDIPGFEKYRGTFLGDEARQTERGFKDMKMSASDVLLPGITDYIGSKITSNVMGEEFPKIFKKKFGAFTGATDTTPGFFKDLWGGDAGKDMGFFEKFGRTAKKGFELPSVFSDIATDTARAYGTEKLKHQNILEALNIIAQQNNPTKY